MVQTFYSNRPWKGVSKTGFKILGAPPKKMFVGVKVPNFVIFRLSRPFLHNGAIYHQSENWWSNYEHPTRWWKNGVLWSTNKYVIAAHSQPPCGRRYSDSTKQRRVNLLVRLIVVQLYNLYNKSTTNHRISQVWTLIINAHVFFSYGGLGRCPAELCGFVAVY